MNKLKSIILEVLGVMDNELLVEIFNLNGYV